MNLRVLETIIIGFGFKTPTYMFNSKSFLRYDKFDSNLFTIYMDKFEFFQEKRHSNLPLAIFKGDEGRREIIWSKVKA